jgi:hypothetical protein
MTSIFFLVFFVVVTAGVAGTSLSAIPVDSNNIIFPGIYSLTTRGQHWKEWKKHHLSTLPKDEENGPEDEPIWLHLDVIQVDCVVLVEGYHCHVHTLIHSLNEYHFLQSKLIMLMKEQQRQEEEAPDFSLYSSSSFVLHYNASLSNQWIEPRLAIQRHYQTSKHNTNNLRPRFLNSDGYSHIAERDCYLDYDGMMEWIQDYIQQANATGLFHLEWKDIGDTYLKTVDSQQGNDIHVLTVSGRHDNAHTNSSTVSPAAPFVLMSSIHAREYAPPELVRQFLLHILQYVEENQRLPHYMEAIQIHWIPYVNVDGRLLAETTEPYRRKNLNKDWNTGSSFCSDDEWGVDLNRNFPFQWGIEGGSSVDACSPMSRGPGPASEPETQAVLQYAIQLFPPSQQGQAFTIHSTGDTSVVLPNNNNGNWTGYNETTTIGVFVDLHSYGQRKCTPCDGMRMLRVCVCAYLLDSKEAHSFHSILFYPCFP